MYKLSVEFETLKELSEFVGKMGGDVMQASVDVAPAEDKPKRSRSPKQAGKENIATAPQESEEMEDVPSPFAEKPPVIETPKVQAEVMPKAAPFNREGAIAKAQALVKDLGAAGFTGAEIAPAISDLIKSAGGVLGKKISEQSDDVVAKILPLFVSLSQQMVASKKQASESSSFI